MILSLLILRVVRSGWVSGKCEYESDRNLHESKEKGRERERMNVNALLIVDRVEMCRSCFDVIQHERKLS